MVHTSFGIIAYKEDESGRTFLIVKNKSGNHWGFPKGTPEEGESEEQTARREFEEETGIRSPEKIEGPLVEETYIFTTREGEKAQKINKFFIGKIETEEKVGEPFDDIDEMCWVTSEEALSLFTFEETRDTLYKAQKILG